MIFVQYFWQCLQWALSVEPQKGRFARNHLLLSIIIPLEQMELYLKIQLTINTL